MRAIWINPEFFLSTSIFCAPEVPVKLVFVYTRSWSVKMSCLSIMRLSILECLSTWSLCAPAVSLQLVSFYTWIVSSPGLSANLEYLSYWNVFLTGESVQLECLSSCSVCAPGMSVHLKCHFKWSSVYRQSSWKTI